MIIQTECISVCFEPMVRLLEVGMIPGVVPFPRLFHIRRFTPIIADTYLGQLATMAKVFILQEQLPAFRVPFYERLGRHVDLTIFFSAPTKLKNRKPTPIPSERSFKVRQVPNLSIGGGRITLHPAMLSAVLREQPDVVVLEARLGFLTTVLTSLLPRGNRRIAWWLSGYEGSSERVNRMKRVVRRAVLGRGDGYICYGSAARRHLEVLRRADRPIFIAFNSLDSDAIHAHRSALLNSPAWEADGRTRVREGADFQILYSGRVEPSKRLPDLLESIRLINEGAPELRLRLVCVGGGEGLQRIADMATEMGIAHLVTFTGPVYDEARLAEYFLSSDVFVLPGTGGLAINQAISYGLPVVTAVADGTEQDTVKEGVNGIYFELGNPSSLAERLLYLARHPELRDHLAQGSLRMAEETSNMNRMVEGFLGAIDTLMDSRR